MRLRNFALLAGLLLIASSSYAGKKDSGPCDDFINPGNVIYACSNPAGQLRSVACPDDCKRNETVLDWSIVGPPGADGAVGPTGPQGEIGPAGPAGADGADGATGPAGADGADGATGPAGADGADGATGPAGADGADGATGPAGADGADGATGPAGADGADGQDGAQGLQGEQGDPGLPGADGATGPAGAVDITLTSFSLNNLRAGWTENMAGYYRLGDGIVCIRALWQGSGNPLGPNETLGEDFPIEATPIFGALSATCSGVDGSQAHAFPCTVQLTSGPYDLRLTNPTPTAASSILINGCFTK